MSSFSLIYITISTSLLRIRTASALFARAATTYLPSMIKKPFIKSLFPMMLPHSVVMIFIAFCPSHSPVSCNSQQPLGNSKPAVNTCSTRPASRLQADDIQAKQHCPYPAQACRHANIVAKVSGGSWALLGWSFSGARPPKIDGHLLFKKVMQAWMKGSWGKTSQLNLPNHIQAIISNLAIAPWEESH